MFGIGGSEFIIIAIIALIFLGPDKLPEATKKISRGIRELKRGTRTIQQTIENDETIGGAIRDLKSAMRGEEPQPRRRRKVKKKVPVIEAAGQVVAAGALVAPATEPPPPPPIENVIGQAPAGAEAAAAVAADAPAIEHTLAPSDSLAAQLESLAAPPEYVVADEPVEPPVALEAPAPPPVRLPPTAGEPDPDVVTSPPGEAEAELAKLVQPVSGTVARSSGVGPGPGADTKAT
jgi:sec-independent protein translocase protein TatB